MLVNVSRMKRSGLRSILAGLALAGWGAGLPELSAEPLVRNYDNIVQRNPFDLRPPPAPVVVAPAPPTNQPAKGSLKLTGFFTLGSKYASFMWTPEGGRTNENITLGLNQEKDGLKVIDIDGKNRAVRVVHHNVEKIMTFATDGITNATPVMVAGVAGAPGIPAPGQPGAGRGGMPPIPGSVPMANPGTPAPIPALPGVLTPSPTTTPAVRTIPSRTVRTPSASQPLTGVPNTFVPVPQQPDMDPSEQILLLEAQRMQYPGLPPTPGLPPPFPGQ